MQCVLCLFALSNISTVFVMYSFRCNSINIVLNFILTQIDVVLGKHRREGQRGQSQQRKTNPKFHFLHFFLQFLELEKLHENVFVFRRVPLLKRLCGECIGYTGNSPFDQIKSQRFNVSLHLTGC